MKIAKQVVDGKKAKEGNILNNFSVPGKMYAIVLSKESTQIN